MHSLLTSNELNEKEVTVWFCNVLQFTERIKLLSRYLSPVELTRAKKFRFSRDRNRYIVQHAVLRLLLSNYIGCEARQVDIRLSTSGKPYLVCNNSDTICFNVSSSGTLAVFAFNAPVVAVYQLAAAL